MMSNAPKASGLSGISTPPAIAASIRPSRRSPRASPSATAPDAHELFDHVSESHELFEQLLAEGRGIIVVTGHCGNWETGSLLMRRTVATLSRSAATMPSSSMPMA